MSRHDEGSQPEENDPVWELLSRDAAAHPAVPSPWFATRVAAQALEFPQKGSRSHLLRWIIPVPLACSALITLAAWNHSRNSEEKFEQHMEFLAASGYDYEV